MGKPSGECAVSVWVGEESVPDLERAIAGADAHPTALLPWSLQACCILGVRTFVFKK